MRSVQSPQPADRDIRHRIGRLDGLPLRPSTARFVLAELPEDSDDPRHDLPGSARWCAVTHLDPGWLVASARSDQPVDPLALLADRPWWPTASREGAEALTRLWRHSVAVSLAARRLACEANDPDPDLVARVGLLHGLGRWAAAAADPEWFARWLATDEPQARRELEIRELGAELGTVGRTSAERWGCDPLVVDAAWLYAPGDRGLLAIASQPGRIALIQEAYRLAECTPWSMSAGPGRHPGSNDPRVKLLIAEVQTRCPPPFIEGDLSPREEALTRSNARLRLKLEASAKANASRERFLNAMTSSHPVDAPETWADRASLAWCEEPGVSAAQVVWHAQEPLKDGPLEAVPASERMSRNRPPAVEHPLRDRSQTLATVRLWSEPQTSGPPAIDDTTLSAWNAWATWVADRRRLYDRLDQVVSAYRQLVGSEEARLRAAKLDALAEFAAGAGHELNNPLAVIVGRAQLLLGRETDPDAARSLRTILTQAQRAHRILRDLMYVARPPEPRFRFCQPDEIVRASVRDARDEAEVREVRLTADSLEHGRRVWADPDGLRHLADSLIRNALEATPRGGHITFASKGDAAQLRWFVDDSGRGITPSESEHLFDPFFCGRQAGRGLGMGLPRAARYLGQVGGEIRYQSFPGQGATFHVRLPLTEPPKPPATEANALGNVAPNGGSRASPA